MNTPYGGDPEGEDGEVPDVWLLSARGNFKIPNTNTTLFVHGENLTDKLYITDREDGIKPGQGRTVWRHEHQVLDDSISPDRRHEGRRLAWAAFFVFKAIGARGVDGS